MKVMREQTWIARIIAAWKLLEISIRLTYVRSGVRDIK
jgi:hypothetical protein